jgi:sugar phosphate isomerase/epimerase
MSFRTGIDSYCLWPLELDPFEVLDWVKQNGGHGVQFSHLGLKDKPADDAFCKDLARHAESGGLYLEWAGGQHIPFDTKTWKPKDLFAVNRKAAEQAVALGTRVIRSCSGGLMRWTDEAPPTDVLLQAMQEALALQKPMLTDLNVVLALELHFEFTTFELVRLFEKLDAEPGGCFGICLDTMNMLTMLEDPVEGTRRVLPWVVATHMKDGGVLPAKNGLLSHTAEVGSGLIDFKRILRLLSTLEREVHLSIEDHGGSFDLPVFNSRFLKRFPDLTATELARLFGMAREGKAGKLKVLDRADWPAHCAARTANGIKRMKRIVEELGN